MADANNIRAALRPLESHVADAEKATELARDYFETLIRSLPNTTRGNGPREFTITEKDADLVLYALNHAERMGRETQKAWNAAWEDAGGK